MGRHNELSHRATQPAHRRGAILVCVLVVMFVVGLMSAQTIQALLMVRQAGRQRSDVRQARELVELGRLAIAQHAVPINGQIELPVDGQPSMIKIVQLDDGRDQTVETNSETSSETQIRYRVIAIYSIGSATEVTATWETPKQETP